MADFTNNVQTGVQSPITPQQGVQDNSVASALGGAGNVISGIGEGLFGANARASRAAIAKEHEGNFIASYEQQQLKLADAVDQGSMSSDEARMRMRANFYKASAAFKGDPDDLARAHANIVNTTGLGKVIQTGTKEEQMKQMLYNDGAKRGFIKPDMSPEQMDLGVAKMQQMDMAAATLQQAQNELTYTRAQLGYEKDKVDYSTARINNTKAGIELQGSRIDLAEKAAQQKSRVALGSMQDSYNYQLSNDLNDIRKRFDAGQIDAKQALLEIDNKMATVRGVVGSLGSYAGNDYINNLMAPMNMRAETMKSYVNGDIDNKILDNQNHKIEATVKNNLLGDPKIAELSVASDLIKNMPYAVQKEGGDLMMNLVRKNSGYTAPTEGSKGSAPANLLSNDPDDKKAAKNYYGLLKGNIATYLEGGQDATPELQRQLDNNLINTLRSVPAYGHLADAKDYNDLTDFLADPKTFGRYATESGGIPVDVRHEAAKVINDDYDNVVIPVLVNKYKESVTKLGGFKSDIIDDPALGIVGDMLNGDKSGEVIHPEFNGTGVVFVSNDTGNYDASSKAKELNKDVAPILNKLIRMHAHLDGNMDYRKTYEVYYASKFDPAFNADIKPKKDQRDYGD